MRRTKAARSRMGMAPGAVKGAVTQPEMTSVTCSSRSTSLERSTRACSARSVILRWSTGSITRPAISRIVSLSVCSPAESSAGAAAAADEEAAPLDDCCAFWDSLMACSLVSRGSTLPRRGRCTSSTSGRCSTRLLSSVVAPCTWPSLGICSPVWMPSLTHRTKPSRSCRAPALAIEAGVAAPGGAPGGASAAAQQAERAGRAAERKPQRAGSIRALSRYDSSAGRSRCCSCFRLRSRKRGWRLRMDLSTAMPVSRAPRPSDEEEICLSK
mmetsp:Transcript_82354/g.246955  ORF Transcript_82354/g.246955 Transcript_82354/m.246955 type:complete len:270 (+) Transcript_82354:385-1194(+)